MQYVRCIRPEIRLKEFTYRRPCQLFQIVLQLDFRVAPRKVCVRLREAALGQAVHHAWPCERLGKENNVGIISAQGVQAPIPEGQSFSVRVVDAEHAYATMNPKLEH